MSEKNKYIFPNIMAKVMKNVPMQVQFESSLMSMSLLLIGMILIGVYTLLYLNQPLVFKILLLINMVAGFMFMSSTLVTTYQQYNSYMDVMQIQGIPQPKINRKKQISFFGGLGLITFGLLVRFKGILDTSIRSPSTRDWIFLGSIALGIILIILVFKKKNMFIGKKKPNALDTQNQSDKVTVRENVTDSVDNQPSTDKWRPPFIKDKKLEREKRLQELSERLQEKIEEIKQLKSKQIMQLDERGL